MKMFLISDNIDTCTGMRLAGVEGVVVHERDELKDALEKAIANKEIGILPDREIRQGVSPDRGRCKAEP